MPMFEYACEQCGHTFEEIVLHGEDVRCPKCGGGVSKLMSSFSVDIPDEECAKLPKGERREFCSECKHAGAG